MASKYEIAAGGTVPIARAMIAKELTNKYNLTEAVVAGYLGVAQAAVSKYINGKYSENLKARMKEIEMKTQGKRELIDGYVRNIAEGKREYVNVCICTICALASDVFCCFSQAYAKNAVPSAAKL